VDAKIDVPDREFFNVSALAIRLIVFLDKIVEQLVNSEL
jgi:hypothetical protein